MWDARLLDSLDELEIVEMSAALANGCHESIVDEIRPGVRESEIVTKSTDGCSETAAIEFQVIVAEDGHAVITRWPCEEPMVCSPR
jgi:hypothetical protein